MIGRLDLYDRTCADCNGRGKSSKNRKRACEFCSGTGMESGCKFCGGTYGKDCVDDVIDQTYCSKE